MPVVEISSADSPGVELFHRLTEAQLRHSAEAERGVLIAESPKVIAVALDMGLRPISLLCESRHIAGDAAPIIARTPGIPIYTGPRELLAGITGYTLTRGVLCAMERPALPSVEQVCKGARRIAVADNVVDATNIGSLFRAAAALGIDGLLLTPDCCDPFGRRAVRVSMGNVFRMPWAWLDRPLPELGRLGLKTIAMALTDRSLPVDSPVLKAEPRLAIVVGTEGDGLPQATIDAADFVARIPMQRGVDSLNVASAAAVAFWELRWSGTRG